MMLLTLLAGLVAVTCVPMLVIVPLARLLGVSVDKISLGAGPLLFQHGKYALRAIPVGASVKFLDTRNLPMPIGRDMASAFDRRPLWVQVALTLAVPFLTLQLAMLLAGPPALRWFASGFAQIFLGAAAPFSRGTAYLGAFHADLAARPAYYVLGLMAAKLAAWNMLPLTGLSGHALIANVSNYFSVSSRRDEQVAKWLTFPLLAIMISWFCAVVAYLGMGSRL